MYYKVVAVDYYYLLPQIKHHPLIKIARRIQQIKQDIKEGVHNLRLGVQGVNYPPTGLPRDTENKQNNSAVYNKGLIFPPLFCVLLFKKVITSNRKLSS